jgi:hypothetical protein
VKSEPSLEVEVEDEEEGIAWAGIGLVVEFLEEGRLA